MLEKAEIIAYGDTKDCEYCEDADKDFTKAVGKSEKIKYTYKNIHDTEGQEFLKQKGVKDNDPVDIPTIKVCKTELDEATGTRKKSCAEVKGYEKDKWKGLEKEELPELDYKEEP